MNQRRSGKFLGHALLFVLTLLLCSIPAARAGGFGISVELPPAGSSDPRVQNAALIVRSIGCHGPGASLSAKAEGLVNGRRTSVPIKLEALAGGGYAVTRQWPTEGAWLISLNAKAAAGFLCNVLVALGPGGEIVARPQARRGANGAEETRQVVFVQYVRGQQKAQKIEMLLRTSAD